MVSKLVYLAGPITGLSYQGATDWRAAAIATLGRFGITGLSPMRSKQYLANEEILRHTYEGSRTSYQSALVSRDFFDCHRADVLLVNLLESRSVSIGTVFELAWAYAAQKPIIVAMTDGDCHDHPFVRQAAGFRVATLDDALHVAISILHEQDIELEEARW